MTLTNSELDSARRGKVAEWLNEAASILRGYNSDFERAGLPSSFSWDRQLVLTWTNEQKLELDLAEDRLSVRVSRDGRDVARVRCIGSPVAPSVVDERGNSVDDVETFLRAAMRSSAPRN